MLDASSSWAVGGSGAFVHTGNGGLLWTDAGADWDGDLYDVAYADASSGWAVAYGGFGRFAILGITDGGARLTEQYVSSKDFFTAVCSVDSQHAWAVGSTLIGTTTWGGTVLSTTDGGLHWTRQATDAPAVLYDVAFVDALHGWAVGYQGKIISTADGGGHWRQQASGTTKSLHGVSFSDSKNGWAIGEGGLILHTADGGLHWAKQQSGTSEGLTSVSAQSPTRGCVVGTNGTVRTTTDGGANWMDESPLPLAGCHFLDIDFADPSSGVAVGAYYEQMVVITTSDGGDTWTVRENGQPQRLGDVFFLDALHGWAVGGSAWQGGEIRSTDDGGLTWSARRPVGTGGLLDVYFRDATRGWISQSDPNGLLATSDGGASWSVVSNKAVRDLTFRDALHGWGITGDLGLTTSGWTAIVATSDGGATWTPQMEPSLTWLGGLVFPTATDGWAVGAAGTILVTDDAGVDWTAQASGTSQDLESVSFVDASSGWACGANGTMLHTTNGGATWTPQQTGVLDHLTEVSFADASHGCAVGGFTTLSTSDGGATWTAKYMGEGMGEFSGVTFVDPTHLWAWTPSGTLLASDTAGCSPPTLSFEGAMDGAWYRSSRTVRLLAAVNAPAAVVSSLTSSLDGGSPQQTPGGVKDVRLDIDPSTHADDGMHTLSFWAVDDRGLTAASRTIVVNVDTRRPGTTAPRSASAVRGRTAKLGYRIIESGHYAAHANVTIKVKNSAGKVVKTLSLRYRPVNTALTATFTVPRTWKRGTYRFSIYATDVAGNTQAKVASNTLIVK
jgi:photosystem II stability/assembly factor-like uncharacterized protein